MKIETKYEMGQRVWVVYENKGEVSVFDDVISYIAVDEERSDLYVKRIS